jgi:hypothetical protein
MMLDKVKALALKALKVLDALVEKLHALLHV